MHINAASTRQYHATPTIATGAPMGNRRLNMLYEHSHLR